MSFTFGPPVWDALPMHSLPWQLGKKQLLQGHLMIYFMKYTSYAKVHTHKRIHTTYVKLLKTHYIIVVLPLCMIYNV